VLTCAAHDSGKLCCGSGNPTFKALNSKEETMEKTMSQGGNKIRCEQCQKDFANQQELDRHNRESHNR